MADSKVLAPLGQAITATANVIGELQVGIDKILWGSLNPQPGLTATLNDSGSLNYSSVPVSPAAPSSNAVGSFVQSGLFNALDALNQVNLCDVVSYLTDMIHFTYNRSRKRPPRETWTALQKAFYDLQDASTFVREQIDKYVAFPNVFIGSYIGTGPNAVPIEQAVTKSEAPKDGGTNVKKFNLYFLMQSIKDTFDLTGASTGSIFSSQDVTTLSTVPGLGANLNFIDNFIAEVTKYTDYRNIPNDDLQRLIQEVNKVRSVCVTIENLDYTIDLKNAAALVGNFLGSDIRAEIQKLSEFLDPTVIIDTLKEINDALRSFIKIAQRVQGVLTLGQFLIKLALILTKVFRFIIQFVTNAPIPAMGVKTSDISRLESAKFAAKDEVNGLTVFLKCVNSLLEVVLVFIRYIVANTNELLSRLNILLITLEGCDAVKNSDVISQLQETRDGLVVLRDQFAAYIIQYDSKTTGNSMFGKYDIRVVDEELTDRAIVNKRRRGIALDPNGRIVAQSDLTFATNTAVIIAEVQQKLMALGLVAAGVGQIDMANLGAIAVSMNYLDTNDILENDLNIEVSAQDSANTAEQLGISSFLEGLPGGSKFKQNSKAVASNYVTTAKTRVKGEQRTNITPGGANNNNSNKST